MRSAAWLVMGLVPLAGCIGGAEDVDLVAFTASYQAADGTAFTMSLEARPYLDDDLQVRDGYWLSMRSDPLDANPFVQVLDSDLSVVRQSYCWVGEGSACQHHRITWRTTLQPTQGVGGLLWGNVTDGDGGLLEVHDRGDPTDLEQFHYEYRPGSLWPERYVRTVPTFDHREILWSLQSVEVGDALPALGPRPPVPPVAPATEPLFPGADLDLPGMPMTIADGLAALEADPEAGPILDGGCVAFVRHFDPFGRGDEGGPLPGPVDPRRAIPGQSYIDELEFGLLDSGGAASAWAVELHRDALGQESIQVQPRDLVNGFTLTSCADRQAPTVGFDHFLASVPGPLQQGSTQSLNLGWAGCCHYGRSGPHDLVYSVQWWTDGEAHFRSASMDASTGRLTELSYKSGDQVDPA